MIRAQHRCLDVGRGEVCNERALRSFRHPVAQTIEDEGEDQDGEEVRENEEGRHGDERDISGQHDRLPSDSIGQDPRGERVSGVHDVVHHVQQDGRGRPVDPCTQQEKRV